MKARYNMSLNPDIVDMLDQMAVAERRSRSSMLEAMVIREFEAFTSAYQLGIASAKLRKENQ